MDAPLFPIGRFSEATRLSVKALRHYDEIGLLEPAVVDPETGYRYYRPGQANHAEAIRVLRDLDMPLDQISEVLAAVAEPDLMKKTLDAHRQRLADELERHGRMIAYLERLLTDEETLMPYVLALETVPDRTIASVRFSTTMETMPEQLGGAFGQVFAALGAAGTAPVGPPRPLPGGCPCLPRRDELDRRAGPRQRWSASGDLPQRPRRGRRGRAAHAHRVAGAMMRR